jgi:hypothetical protein
MQARWNATEYKVLLRLRAINKQPCELDSGESPSASDVPTSAIDIRSEPAYGGLLETGVGLEALLALLDESFKSPS